MILQENVKGRRGKKTQTNKQKLVENYAKAIHLDAVGALETK